jgi:hypothetical protein
MSSDTKRGGQPDAVFEEQIEVARRIMKERRDALRALAQFESTGEDTDKLVAPVKPSPKA